MVEWLTVNQYVPGSSPGVGAKWPITHRVKREPCQGSETGSSPV